MASGYSSNPLYNKLGIKEGMHTYILHKPEHFETLLEGAFEVLKVTSKPKQELDYVHIFTTSNRSLKASLVN